MASTIVDVATGLRASAAIKVPVKAALTTNLTLSGEQTVNGIACVDGDRVGAFGQATGADVGIYIVSTGDWERAPDMDEGAELEGGTLIYVAQGSNAGLWAVTNTSDITVGTTTITLARYDSLNYSGLAIAGWDALARYTGSVAASGGVLDLETATAPFLALGAGAITSVSLSATKLRLCRTTAAIAITPSATLIVNAGVPNSQVHNIPSGSLVLFIGDTSSTVRVFVLDTGGWSKGADILSAATITLTPNAVHHVTSTTTITDIDFSPALDGAQAWVVFDGALTLTHNATTLQLPGGANIVTAAGDRALFVQDATDNVICLEYVRAGGGTWTPTITFGGGSTGITYGTRIGKWSYIAPNVAVVTCEITLTSKGSSTGTFALGTLPVTPATSFAVTPNLGTNLYTVSVAGLVLISAAGSTSLAGREPNTSGQSATGAVADTDFTDTSTLNFTAIIMV